MPSPLFDPRLVPHHKASTFVFGQLRCNTRLLMHTNRSAGPHARVRGRRPRHTCSQCDPLSHTQQFLVRHLGWVGGFRCSKSIRRQVLTGLERLPAMIIIVDHLGKEVQAPHADSALSTPTASSRMHAPRRTRKNRRALTVVGLGVMLALIKLAPVCATPSKRVHQSFAEAGECGCVRARERREHGSDIQGRLVPQLCHPGKAVTLGRVNCEC